MRDNHIVSFSELRIHTVYIYIYICITIMCIYIYIYVLYIYIYTYYITPSCLVSQSHEEPPKENANWKIFEAGHVEDMHLLHRTPLRRLEMLGELSDLGKGHVDLVRSWHETLESNHPKRDLSSKLGIQLGNHLN